METCWNVTIQDTSPIFKYFPYADGDTQGWTGVFREGNQVVNGTWQSGLETVSMSLLVKQWPRSFSTVSPNVSATPETSLTNALVGTAIYLNGATMGNMQYEVELDGQVTAGQPNGGPLGFIHQFVRVNKSTPFCYDPSLRPQEIGWHCSLPLLLPELA
jgi:hypothetical protein